MSDGLLMALKFCFLALLYLFFARALRAVLVSVRSAPGSREVGDSYSAGAADSAARPSSKSGPMSKSGSGSKPQAAAVVPTALVVREPRSTRGTRFTIGDELTIGRAPGCHVSLPDDGFVSQLHARVYRRMGAVHIEDLGSTNGTRLNGKPLQRPTELRPGDRIQFGGTTLELVA